VEVGGVRGATADLLQEGSNAWGPARVYVHGNRMDEIVWSYNTFTGEQAFHHYDARGHCTLLTDSLAYILEQYEYDAFGQPYFYDAMGTATIVNGQPGSLFGNRFLFTGREWLGDLKLYDYRNRMYQPELGRFLQPDPQEFAAGDYNLYRYCGNDPVNRSDPMGLLTLDYQKLQPVLGSNIPQWVTKFTVTFNDNIGGNHANEKPESHSKPGLIANNSPAHGKTEANAWTRDLGSQKLEANLVIDWWVNPAAVAKFGYANIARLEKEHTFGGGYKMKGLIEKGGFWDQERDKIKSIDVFRFRDSAYAAQKLTDQINSDLREFQRYQKAEMDIGGRSAPHYLPPF
jgi:RHS repeat-associated protein